MHSVTVLGGGLAGTEAAWQLAEQGIHVVLYEMRPKQNTGAHVSGQLAELVCSNSFGSKLRDRATGLLQHEMRLMGSKLIDTAYNASVPAGSALAVDREAFAQSITNAIYNHPNITVIREEAQEIPNTPTIIATGPLTSDALARKIAQFTGQDYLYFYDAVSPIVMADTIDLSVAFRANRYGRGEDKSGDYINCPMSQKQYENFVEALINAETMALKDFEKDDPNFFEGCVPIEQLAKRGKDTLAFGPMRPVGIKNPHTNERSYAVVQLRRDNIAATLYNLVGFQTNVRWGQQKEILRLIPGLQNAEFIRMGQMHRNTFINSPSLLRETMQFKDRPDLFFAGQITGIEGYVGNIATGLIAAVNMSRVLNNDNGWVPPQTTMVGALCYYITHAEAKHFQPMKANFGILPDLPERVKDKRERYRRYSDRSVADLTLFLQLDKSPANSIHSE